jgi:hypothetical protein
MFSPQFKLLMDLNTNTETPEMSPFLIKSKKFKINDEENDDLNLDSPNLSPIKENLINYF